MNLRIFHTKEKFTLLDHYIQVHTKALVLVLKKHRISLVSSIFLFIISIALYAVHIYITLFLIQYRPITVFASLSIIFFGLRCWLLIFYFYPRSFRTSRVIQGDQLNMLYNQTLAFQKHMIGGIRIIILLTFDLFITLFFEFFIVAYRSVSSTFVLMDTAVVGLLLLTTYFLLKKHIDFEMDFVIITPDVIHFFDQNWFFSYTNSAITTKQITNIQFKQNGIIENVLDIGTMSVLLITSTQQSSSIEFWNISMITQTENKIRAILLLQ